MQALVTINNTRMNINVYVNAKIIDEGLCNKGFIRNPSNCECECDTSCDIGEHLDYSNCKRRKKLVDKLIEECTKNTEETKLVETSAESEHKYSSCTLYIVLFWICFIFTVINIGIGTYFTYYKYIKRNKKCSLIMITLVKQPSSEFINGRSQNYH